MDVCKPRIRRTASGLLFACASVLALSAAHGCVRPIVPGVPGLGMDTLSIRRPPGDHGRRGELIQVSEKVVAGKQAPSTLLAEDGSRCTVTKKRFEDTREGDRATCGWRRDDRAP
ncbi:MAG: hypothetical protein ABR499_03455 [Gemmatimonadaceae bacterium]